MLLEDCEEAITVFQGVEGFERKMLKLNLHQGAPATSSAPVTLNTHLCSRADVHAHIPGSAGGVIKLKARLGVGSGDTDQRGKIEVGCINIHRRGPVARCPLGITALDVPRPLLIQSWRTAEPEAARRNTKLLAGDGLPTPGLMGWRLSVCQAALLT